MLGSPAKLTHVPTGIVKSVLQVMHRLTSSRVYGPFEFVTTILSNDMVAPAFGQDTLGDYF
ncbi:hypothetical protein A8C56_07355 [Niabella ginsenosidivorans]|uniref:Uncharacterized protein n=1 Tax=Niabella ginsenosidivorans TaxID=1176587 RepID=A0A1A9I179_9BACT|nr:hypothetical protein [Niabella ginsenosidivorans]ANH80819.1 hypothetical protein A8C56_07355 [Niabella ginsenosidivorans]